MSTNIRNPSQLYTFCIFFITLILNILAKISYFFLTPFFEMRRRLNLKRFSWLSKSVGSVGQWAQWVSGSVGQWVSGSVGQWVSRSVGSVGQWVSRSVGQLVSRSIVVQY